MTNYPINAVCTADIGSNSLGFVVIHVAHGVLRPLTEANDYETALRLCRDLRRRGLKVRLTERSLI